MTIFCLGCSESSVNDVDKPVLNEVNKREANHPMTDSKDPNSAKTQEIEESGKVQGHEVESGEVKIGEVPQPIFEKIKQSLSETLGHDDMRLVKADAVTWPDGSMGCAKPGMMYPQMLVPGYHVIFHADNKRWDYRVNERGNFILCQDKKSKSP